MYLDSGSTAGKLVAGLYRDNGGHPGSLLAQGSAGSPRAGSWNSVTLSSSAPVTAGTAYWIAILAPSGKLVFRDVHGSGASENASQGSMSALPSSWSSGKSWPDGPLSAYGTPAPASAAAVVAPGPPGNLNQSASTTTSISVSWTSSSSGLLVSGYQLYRDGGAAGTTSGTTYTFSGLACGRSYGLAVDAYDALGDHSSQSTATGTTKACPDSQAPSVPASFRATGATGSTISLAWNASSDNVGVAGYDVYNGAAKLGSTTGTSYSVTGLSCGRSYSFAVDAFDAAGNVSGQASATMATAACPDSQAPSAPSGLKVASATQASISLSWKASSDNVGVSGYDVYNGGTKAGSTSGTSYTLSGLACGSAYTLAVDAFDAAGNLSSKTSVSGSTAACAPSDTQAPSVPQNQRMTGATQTSISMSWSASSDNVGVSGYNLYRDGTKVGSTTQTSYTFSGLKCGTTYTLGLSAFDAAGNESDPSQAEGSASTSACPSSGDTQPPTTPTGLAVSGASQSGMTLSWNASSDNVGVTAYDVYNGTQLMGSVTSRSYSYTGLQCGTTYSLGVAARDAAGNVSPKATASGQTAACSGGGSGGDVFISPNGSDSAACTQSAPCKSFDRAYHVAGPGDVVIVAAGTYPGQTLTADGSKAPTASIANVVFQPASGASVSVSGELRVEGSHVEFHDMSFGDWYAGINSNVAQSSQTAHLGFYNVTARSFYDHASYVDIIGGSYGPLTDDATQVSDCYQCNYSPQHITVDGVYFHDFVRKTDGIHMECLHVYAASYLTVRNSRFYNCAIMDLFINNYSGSPDIHDIVVENNFFDTPGSHGGSLSDGSYSLYVTPYFSGRSISNVTVRNNSSLGTLLIDNGTQGATIKNAEMANNLSEMAGYQCIGSGQGVTYSHNVWYSGSSTTKACGSTDKALSGGSSAAGYVNVSAFDLHLTNSSPAVNAGDPNDTPTTDIDGQRRPMGSAPDAGADEHA